MCGFVMAQTNEPTDTAGAADAHMMNGGWDIWRRHAEGCHALARRSFALSGGSGRTASLSAW